MSSGASKSKSSTTQTPFQQAQYSNLLGQADKWLSEGGLSNYYGGSENFDSVANLTPEQQAAITSMQGTGNNLSTIYNGQGTQALSDALGQYDPTKTGLAAAQSATAEQATYDFETGQMGNIRQGATQAGQYGSTRAGIAEGLARGRLAQGIANNNAQLAYQDQQAFNQNKTNTLNNLTAISKGLSSGAGLSYDAGALEQSQQQNELAGQLEKWAYENNVGANELLLYKQLISGDMGGTVNSTASGPKSNALMGFLGQVGGQAAGSYFGGTGPFASGGGGAGVLR